MIIISFFTIWATREAHENVSHSVQLFATPWTVARARFLCLCGILQARILEYWLAIPFSRGSSQPRDRTRVSRIVGRFFTNWAIREVLIHSLQQKYVCTLEKAMATHSSTLAWKIPWMEGPGGLQFMGSLGVRHDQASSLSLFAFMHWRRKWQPIPVFLPGESQGQGSLVGCRLWGRTESDTTEAT